MASLGHVVLGFVGCETGFELLGQRVAHLGDPLETVLQGCVRVAVFRGFLGDLHANVADGLAGVGHAVGAEIDLLVLHDLVAQEVP